MSDNYDPGCLLCRLTAGNVITKLYWKDKICVVVDCSDCGLPQIVLNHHGEPTEKEFNHMKIVSKKLFPDKEWRGFRRKIHDHFHEHFV